MVGNGVNKITKHGYYIRWHHAKHSTKDERKIELLILDPEFKHTKRCCTVDGRLCTCNHLSSGYDCVCLPNPGTRLFNLKLKPCKSNIKWLNGHSRFSYSFSFERCKCTTTLYNTHDYLHAYIGQQTPSGLKWLWWWLGNTPTKTNDQLPLR